MSSFCAPRLHPAISCLSGRGVCFFREGALRGPYRGACAGVGAWGLAGALTVGRVLAAEAGCLGERSLRRGALIAAESDSKSKPVGWSHPGFRVAGLWQTPTRLNLCIACLHRARAKLSSRKCLSPCQGM